MNRLPLYVSLLAVLTACHSRPTAPVVEEIQPATELPATPQATGANLQRTIEAEGFSSKGTIQAVTEVPVYSRINEQIIQFDIELGQRIRKGQVVVRLSPDALNDRIARCRAELEQADFQYQAILMGQGYKRDHLDAAPDNIKQLARINSGYNEAKAELHELEHQLSYCTITAPVSGAVSQIKNTLYGAALPGEALFYIVDTGHLKVSFDVLENEMSRYQMGTRVSVTTVAYPSEQHPATISAISPVIDDNGMVHIEAALDPHPHLTPGMTAFVTL